MRRIAIFLIFKSLIFTFNCFSKEFQNEKINYVVTYKWGLIQKDAGDIEVILKNNGDKYNIELRGKTKPWADKFFEVRDTLKGSLLKNGFKPLTYTRIAHEKKKYSRDDIKYEYSGGKAYGDIKKIREKKDGSIETKTAKIEGEMPAYDLLSVFYFLRNLDYKNLLSGHVVKASIFSGDQSENLTVKYIGEEKVKMRDKSEKDSYHIKFNFTSGGKKKSSDDIDAWISIDDSHVPLLIVGSLPIGQIRCHYLP